MSGDDFYSYVFFLTLCAQGDEKPYNHFGLIWRDESVYGEIIPNCTKGLGREDCPEKVQLVDVFLGFGCWSLLLEVVSKFFPP